MKTNLQFSAYIVVTTDEEALLEEIIEVEVAADALMFLCVVVVDTNCIMVTLDMCLLSVAYAVVTDASLFCNVEFANLVCLAEITFILLVFKGTRVVCNRDFVSKFVADGRPGLVS
jgi:hypothetical protein